MGLLDKKPEAPPEDQRNPNNRSRHPAKQDEKPDNKGKEKKGG